MKPYSSNKNKIENCADSQYKYFTFVSMLYCTALIFSVLLPYKIVDLFGFSLPGGAFIFPVTYLMSGAIAEVYGRKMALKMVWSSICCLFLFNLSLFIIIRVPSLSSPSIPNQSIFTQTFGSSLRLFGGYFAGLICSDVSNVYRITRLKWLFKGKHFIFRCIWSAVISSAIFNVVTYSIMYIGVIHSEALYRLMVHSWALKTSYAVILAVPLLLLMRFLKKAEFGLGDNSIKSLSRLSKLLSVLRGLMSKHMRPLNLGN